MPADIIVESGATKTDFCLMRENGDEFRCRTSGINLATMDTGTVSPVLGDAVSRLNALCGADVGKITARVHFYGAGLLCGDSALDEMLLGFFPHAAVETGSDLLAAARALCGREPGVAAILGTGSNSCEYDGSRIVRKVCSCGYILGDFGGGAALGRSFLADYLQDMMPAALSLDFRSVYGVDYASAVSSVYKGDAPGRYLASFAPYIRSVAAGERVVDDSSRAYAAGLVKENFRTFVRRCLKQYDTASYTIGAVGSFGWACRDFLTEVFQEEGIRLSRIMPSPMDGLIEYHREHVQ